ncbi:MAG: hypothetical protein AB2591_05085 [Candidatus Thiodiazotropha sp.]
MSHSPPTVTEFYGQVTGLIAELGAAAFCASPGGLPQFTLFVDGNRVIAEPRNAPRHPYGVYCTLSEGLTEEQLTEHLHKWLNSGEAYQQFLSMNLCRYNC